MSFKKKVLQGNRERYGNRDYQRIQFLLKEEKETLGLLGDQEATFKTQGCRKIYLFA